MAGLRLMRGAALRLRRQPLLLLPAAALLVAGLVLAGMLVGPGQAGPEAGRGATSAGHQQPSAAARSPVSPSAADASRPTSRPTPRRATPLPSAILATHSGPFASSTFEVRDAWHGAVGSTVIWVYAGTALSPGGTRTLTAPGIRMYIQMQDGGEPYSVFQGSYAAPGADSALTITGFNGSLLTLQTDRGKVYRFDVIARRFL